ncbi:MAG: ferrochelatase [Gammaproteobacteria bacterium]
MARFVNEPNYRHETPERIGVLLTNLGTPASPTPGDVRRYLAEFLSDPRVVEVPRLVWLAILHGVVLRTRPKKSAEAYEKVWGEDGSPLLRIGLQQRDALRPLLQQRLGEDVVVELAMRYGEPSIANVMEAMRQQHVRRLIVLPLYPQYSATTTAATIDEITRVLRRWRWLPELRTINQYHDQDGYVNALADSVREYWEREGRGEKLLFSFHGIPKRNLLSGDPYHCQCHKTARLCADVLGLNDNDWSLSFQSRLGKAEWLRPYTDEVLERWGQEKVGRVDVLCPGFSADCLETLEEVALGYAELFEEKGGGELQYIAALNDNEAHMRFLADLAVQHAGGWIKSMDEAELEQTRVRAVAMGAER